MSLKKFIIQDYRYVIFEQIFKDKFNSNKRKKEASIILESAINTFAKKGLDKVTLLMISKDAGISKTKLIDYYPKKEFLILDSIKFTRVLFQRYVVSEIAEVQSAKKMIEVYVDCCLRWPKYFPNHTSLWLSFLHLSTRKNSYKEINTKAVAAGFARLKEIVAYGISTKDFHCSNVDATVRVIHHIVTGMILSFNTEDGVVIENEIDEIKKYILHDCLKYSQSELS